MALKIQKWNLRRSFLFITDVLILLVNIVLLCLIAYTIYQEYSYRGTLKLFIVPFLVSLLNVVIDLFMNNINLKVKYTGHNKYGMITRFFMFYFIILMASLTEQKSKYIHQIKDIMKDISKFTILLGIINEGLLILSMILSFITIDKQNTEQILISKKKQNEMITIEKNSLLNDVERMTKLGIDSDFS